MCALQKIDREKEKVAGSSKYYQNEESYWMESLYVLERVKIRRATV